MGLVFFSTLLFMQALVAGQQLQSAPPNSSWISHLRVLGGGCSNATAKVAPDSSSFTITWQLDQPDQALSTTGSQAVAGSLKRDCGVAFILEMPPAQSNRSAIFLDSERSGTWPLESGSKAMIHSSMAALSDLWPVSQHWLDEGVKKDGLHLLLTLVLSLSLSQSNYPVRTLFGWCTLFMPLAR